MTATTVIKKIDKIDGWWDHLPANTRWFVGSISAAVILGSAGGLLG